MLKSIAALIVAGGSGVRAGPELPKQYRLLGGRPVLRRVIDAFLSCSAISFVQMVVASDHAKDFAAVSAGLELPPPAIGGKTRQESVRQGLDALAPNSPDLVLIHDGARPLVSTALILRVVQALEGGADAVIPVLPVSDSLKRRETSGQWSAIAREDVFRSQTPQGFRFEAIHAAHQRLVDANATDDIALAELAGMNVVSVPGDEANIKITTAADFDIAERMLASTLETRTGYGFDVHRFVPGDHVWLCGIRILHEQGLEGHSDADAGLHALTDAILGALAAGDIGQHFPPSDEKWRDAPSRLFLEHAGGLVRQAGGEIVHCDVTLICEAPKIGPHRESMRASIAEILGADVSAVSVKATTTEGLGFIGRGEGLAAQAVATIRLPRR
jgi:2-C-methyl-D-erythritol 4-phosphate cytidylyltransferase/2-C-methyl-D-erythritol 2,4-cyclodiphosphate synthase